MPRKLIIMQYNEVVDTLEPMDQDSVVINEDDREMVETRVRVLITEGKMHSGYYDLVLDHPLQADADFETLVA